MKSIKKYIVVSPILLCLLVSICTPFIASAVTTVIDIPLNEPLSSDNSGYVVLICQYNDTGTYFPIVYSWFGASQIDADSSFYFDIHVTKTNIKFTTKSTGSVAYFFNIREYPGRSSSGKLGNYYSYMTNTGSVWERSYTYEVDLTDCTIWKIIPSGNYGVITSDTNASTSRDFTLNWNDDYYDEFYDTINSLLISIGEMQLTNEELTKIFDILTLINNNLDLTNEQLVETYSLLSDYLEKIYLLDRSIEDTLTWLYDEFYWWSYEVTGNQARIIELLEQLIEGEKPSNQDSMQESYDDFADIEQDLINNEEASDAIGNFDVTIEGGAYSVIWNMITDFLNSNSKVFGLFIACLTLAFIALLLHR